MAFEGLSEKLQNVFRNLRNKGRLTEDDVKAAMREVKMALLEADVNFKVVKTFISSVQERAVGQDVLKSLTPGQMVIKIVNEELIRLMGDETTEIALKPGNEITTIMMTLISDDGFSRSSTVSPPSRLISSSLTILMTICPGVREFSTSVPTARSSTERTNRLTTL